MTKNTFLKRIGMTILAGGIILSSVTNVNLPNPIAVEASAYQNVTLKQGMRHKDVVTLKRDLAKAGFTVPGKGTNFYGKQTTKQVKAFQKYYGLSTDGSVGNQVKSALKKVTNSPFQNGKRHKDTVQLKRDLATAGFKVPGKGTNLYGAQTAKKVKAFQKKHKLVQNGIADTVTLAKLNQATSKAAPTQTIAQKERATLDLINDYRVEKGLPALKYDSRAAKYARNWSQHLSKTGKWEHSNLGNLINNHDDMTLAGENLVKGTSSNKRAVQAWKDSPGHNENMLDPNFTHFGLGYEPKGNYWTLILIKVQ